MSVSIAIIWVLFGPSLYLLGVSTFVGLFTLIGIFILISLFVSYMEKSNEIDRKKTKKKFENRQKIVNYMTKWEDLKDYLTKYTNIMTYEDDSELIHGQDS